MQVCVDSASFGHEVQILFREMSYCGMIWSHSVSGEVGPQLARTLMNWFFHILFSSYVALWWWLCGWSC